VRRWGVRIAKFAVTFVGIGWVFSRISTEFADQPDVAIELLTAVRYDFLFGALVLTAISMFFSSLQWRFLLGRQGIDFSIKKATRLYFVGLFFNTFMPGNVGGDAKKIYDVYSSEGDLSRGFTATVFDRLFGLFVLTLIGVVAGFLSVHRDLEGGRYLLPSLWIFLGMLLLFVALLSRRVGEFILLLFRKIKFQWGSERFFLLFERFRLYRKGQLLTGVLLFSLVIQSTRILVHWMLALSLGLEAPLVIFFFFVPLIGIVSALPISIGGFGPRELIAQNLFSLVSFSSIESFVLTELSVLVVIAVSLPGGIAFLFSEKRKMQPKRNKSLRSASS